MTLVLTGGYATEAHCGGRIARPHGDIDVRILMPDLCNLEVIFSDIREILSKEGTKWNLRKQSEDDLEYLEEDERKEFFEKRRLELKLRDMGQYGVELEDGELVDSRGRLVKIKVFGLLGLVASKIHKFYEIKGGVDTTRDRHSSASDYIDLKRLLSLARLEKQQVINKLASSKELKDLPEPAEQAIEEYNHAFLLLNKYFEG